VTRLNLGCGAYRKGPGWTNVDEDPATEPDWVARVPPIDRTDESVAEVWMGHLLEHLEPTEADFLLRECHRVLVPGGRLGVVVPDTRRILACYLRQDHTEVEVPQGQHWRLDDLDHVCQVFLFSTVQQSRHRWAYDAPSLQRALERAGFTVGGRIDPWRDPRHSVGAWWNLGLEAVKLTARAAPGTEAAA
jgi:predicted SAM-dependent methyltransferase